jgi:hypothetical protein
MGPGNGSSCGASGIEIDEDGSEAPLEGVLRFLRALPSGEGGDSPERDPKKGSRARVS